MYRSFAASIAIALALLLLGVLVIFNIVQVNHLESLVVEAKNQSEQLSRRVNRLTNTIESGAFAVNVNPSTHGGGVGPQTDAFGNPLTPVQLAQRRYYTEEEWEGLLAPGNMLVPRSQAYHLPDTEDGGHLRRSFINDVPGLNPIVVSAADVTELYGYVNRTLSRRARDNPDMYAAELAYRVEVNEDHTEYHVYLREGVKYHRPAVDFSDSRYAWLDVDHYVTADDFVFFYEVVQNEAVEAPFLRNYFEDFDHVEVIDDHEFVVHWKRPFQGSIDATLTIEPLPRWLYAYDEDGDAFSEEEFGTRFNQHWFNTNAIGPGPYRLVRYEQNRSIELERFDEYYDEMPPIERMTFLIMPDENTRLNSLLAGEIDYMDLEPLQYNQTVLRAGQREFQDGTILHEAYQGTSYRYLGWNSERPYFSDRRVRRAMTHALNRERMIEEIFFGLGRVITGPFFIDGPYYDHDLEPYAFDLELAARLLDQAGWEDSDGDGIRDRVVDGQRVDFEFTMLCYGYRPEFMAAMDIYKNDLASIGVVMDVEGVQWAIMMERMQNKDFDAYTGGWVLGWDADPYQIWHSSQADVPAGSNRVGFRNAEADAIIEEARGTFDLERRIELFRRFHEIIHEEQPYTFFFAPREVGAWRSHLHNVQFAPLRPFDLSLPWYLAQN
jgi:ABC-type transport system substrate-binding protein